LTLCNPFSDRLILYTTKMQENQSTIGCFSKK